VAWGYPTQDDTVAAETPIDFFPDGQHVEEVRRAL